MPLLAVIWSAVAFFIQETLIKFLVLAALFFLVITLTPLVISAISPFISSGLLNSAFTSIPPGVWFFLDFFALDLGIPLLISAHVARFVIRRLPVIG